MVPVDQGVERQLAQLLPVAVPRPRMQAVSSSVIHLCLGRKPRLLSGRKAESRMAGFRNHDYLRHRIRELAAYAFMGCRVFWGSVTTWLFQLVQKPGYRGVMEATFLTSDATPLKLGETLLSITGDASAVRLKVQGCGSSTT